MPRTPQDPGSPEPAKIATGRTLDARGLSCPLPLIEARRALAAMAAGELLVVLATDPEAPIDLAALAADEGHGFGCERDGAEWRLELTKAG